MSAFYISRLCLPFALTRLHRFCYPILQKGNYQDRVVTLVPRIHHAIARATRNSCYYLHHTQVHSSRRHGKMRHLMIGIFLDLLYPKSIFLSVLCVKSVGKHTCIVTNLSSTITSFVKKSAPIVALYCPLNLLLTYWFINDVLPTLRKSSTLT
jgi:hypothetical protein